MSSSPNRQFARRGLLDLQPSILVIGIATAAGLFFTLQIYFSWALRGDASWWQSMYWAFGDWYEWALLAPAIFWLSRRFPFSKQSWPLSLLALLASAVLFALVHAALCAGAAVLQGVVTGPATTFGASLRNLLATRTPFNLVVFATIVCAWHVWRHYRNIREREHELAALRTQLAEAQLFALRMQLNPHFLYNTLNAISSLMLTDVTAANRMVSRLGALLRTTLESEATPEIPLERELAFLRDYLDIESIRFGDRLRIQIDPEPAALAATVPNFILQPLVENALKHALEHREAGGELALRAHRRDDSLVLEVADNGPGRASNGDTPTPGMRTEHIGLQNTRERLEKLYGSRQQLHFANNAQGGLTAVITIPFRSHSTIVSAPS